MGNNIRSSSRPKALAPSIPMPPLADAMDAVHLSVDRFCLLAGVEALAEMMEEDATTVCGARHRRHGDRRGYRWGRTHSEIGYHGGKVKVARPRVRDRAGKEVSLESWQALRDGNLLLEWALNLMVLNVSTRKYHRAVRLPEGDLAKARGDGTSKSAVSRRFVALSRKKMKAWLASDLSDLSELDLLVIQIDGLHVGDHVLMAAIGVDGNGDKHVLAVVEGATENTVVVQALIDNLLARGLDPTLPRLFIVDGAKALSKAIRNTFGVAAAIQRCQVHKGRNIIERLPQHLHASVKKALRQAWDQDDANKAERLLRNLVRRLEHEEPGVSGSILEGLEEILTVIRLGLPHELRRSLACTNIVENALGTVRQVTRNVKRWRHAEMALRWTAAGLLEAQCVTHMPPFTGGQPSTSALENPPRERPGTCGICAHDRWLLNGLQCSEDRQGIGFHLTDCRLPAHPCAPGTAASYSTHVLQPRAVVERPRHVTQPAPKSGGLAHAKSFISASARRFSRVSTSIRFTPCHTVEWSRRNSTAMRG